MKDKRILILTPSLENSGGVANYYGSMQHEFPFEHELFIVGNRETGGKKTAPGILLRMVIDYIRFFFKLLTSRYDLILINPSLNYNGISRDYIFFLIAKLFLNRTIIFFRGWDNDCAESVFRGKLKTLFKPLLYSDGFIVLSKSFSEYIEPARSTTPVFVDTTVFNEKILPGDFAHLYQHKHSLHVRPRLLFFSRIEKDKGVYECIEAFQLLQQRSIDIELVIAGNGSESDGVNNAVEAVGSNNISFVGRVHGDDKRSLLLSSDILLFPSVHAEGMPNTVLEGLACGQAVISTTVGGLCDFFDGEKMGAALEDCDAEKIADTIIRLIDDRKHLKEIAQYNYDYAKAHFHSSRVAQRIDSIIDAVLSGEQASLNWFED